MDHLLCLIFLVALTTKKNDAIHVLVYTYFCPLEFKSWNLFCWVLDSISQTSDWSLGAMEKKINEGKSESS